MKTGIQLLGVCLLAVGCSSATAPAPAATPTPQPVATGDRMTPAEIEAAYNARIAADRMRFVPADARFMAGMIHHHAQAIVMSRMVPSRTENPTIRTLAARIINAQADEINAMQQWLRLRNQPVPELHEMDGQMMVHGAGHDTLMTGMLTPEQLKQLELARGNQFDRLFLTFMIQHHRGAVTMVHNLFGTGAGQDDTVFKFASDVQADQTSEVTRMERILAALPAGNR